MIIWSGRGILALLFLLVMIVLSAAILPEEWYLFGNAFGALVAGTLSWFLGVKWNIKDGKIFRDESTGQRFMIKNQHTLFWIPMQYYGPIFGVLAILVAVKINWIAAVVTTVFALAIAAFIYLMRDKSVETRQEIRQTLYEDGKAAKKEDFAAREQMLREQEQRRKEEREDPNRFMPQ